MKCQHISGPSQQCNFYLKIIQDSREFTLYNIYLIKLIYLCRTLIKSTNNFNSEMVIR